MTNLRGWSLIIWGRQSFFGTECRNMSCPYFPPHHSTIYLETSCHSYPDPTKKAQPLTPILLYDFRDLEMYTFHYGVVVFPIIMREQFYWNWPIPPLDMVKTYHWYCQPARKNHNLTLWLLTAQELNILLYSIDCSWHHSFQKECAILHTFK